MSSHSQPNGSNPFSIPKAGVPILTYLSKTDKGPSKQRFRLTWRKQSIPITCKTEVFPKHYQHCTKCNFTCKSTHVYLAYFGTTMVTTDTSLPMVTSMILVSKVI